jgi:hypothetical protein
MVGIPIQSKVIIGGVDPGKLKLLIAKTFL